jgi:hypothetical protein
MAWPTTMEGVPEHIKSTLTSTIAQTACHAHQFSDVCIFDIDGTIAWAIDVLERCL